MVVWGHPENCLGPCGSWKAQDAVLLDLAGNALEDATFQGWVCVVLLRTAFQPGMGSLPDGLGPVHVQVILP